MPGDDERTALTTAIDDSLRTVARALKGGLRHSPADLGLTLGQLNCLRTIAALGEPSMSELSASTGLRPSTVTGLVDALIERGQVERRDDATDRRVVRVRLSPEGTRQQRRHMTRMQARLAELLSDLDTADLRQVSGALSLLQGAVQRRAGEEAAR